MKCEGFKESLKCLELRTLDCNKSEHKDKGLERV